MSAHKSTHTSFGAQTSAHASLGAHMSAHTSFEAHLSSGAHTSAHMCAFLPRDPTSLIALIWDAGSGIILGAVGKYPMNCVTKNNITTESF